MSDSYGDVKSAKAAFASAIYQLLKKIVQYRIDSRLDEAEIADLQKILQDLTHNFEIVADAAKTTKG